ncbi:MAG: deoxyguanosinetriphosphate triphosphohydrolase family protein [Dehalococcoidia bacterium]
MARKTPNSAVLRARAERFRDGDRPDDNRSPFQRDRDRILYTTAFRRLAGVTQVAAAGETQVLHNRLTHTLEVAQIARRLAEYLIDRPPVVVPIEPDVVEAAALAHDLGHPPFGHEGESELDRLVTPMDPDGFEGNAQTFRIVNRLAIRHPDFAGLNLTRATLNATLKYPWRRATSGKHHTKYGAYAPEQEFLEFARKGISGDSQGVEAAIMDWADDIAYSVHDLYDFARAGLIPLDRLSDRASSALNESLDSLEAKWQQGGVPDEEVRLRRERARTLLHTFTLDRPFDGTRKHRAALRAWTSHLINRYIRGTETPDVGPPVQVAGSDPSSATLTVEPGARAEVEVLKGLTQHFVIGSPRLATLQYGQREVIRAIFRAYLDDALEPRPRLFVLGWAEALASQLAQSKDDKDRRVLAARVVADFIAGLTEPQALALHARLTGSPVASLFDPVH